MELSFDNVFTRLEEKKITLDCNTLRDHLNYGMEITKKIIDFFKEDNITGFEINSLDKSSSEINMSGIGRAINPLLWELGHVCYFYDYHCLRYLTNRKNVRITDGYIYDSFKTGQDARYNYRNHSKSLIFQYFDYIEYSMNEYLKDDRIINNKITYLILLVILHNHMHYESFIFSTKLLGYSNPIKCPNVVFSDNEIKHEWIKIPGGKFNQGAYEGQYNFSFDNEMPSFEKIVDDFEVLNMLVTEGMVLDFIKEEGYSNNELWSVNGKIWRDKNKIIVPMYWVCDNNEFYIKNYDKIRKIVPNYPICHISWYEAEAICKWAGGRLPTESEWEFIATNGGETRFPWGNEWIENICNLNYSGGLCKVDDYKKSANNQGVIQLIGNVWEWCQESLYPYDGYKIDPVYREMSYPFFGFKKILKGGCWAVPDILINPKYRNAQLPDTRIQFTGIRVVR